MRLVRSLIAMLLVFGMVMPAQAVVNIRPASPEPSQPPAISYVDESDIAAVLRTLPVTAPAGAPTVSAKGYIMLDAATGTIMLEGNADKQLPIASVNKIMSLLLFMEAQKAGSLSWDDKIMVSKNAAGMGGSQVLLDPNIGYLVSDLMKSVIVSSGNDATVALAEHVAGSEAAFVEMMNKRAQELGMHNTVFINCTGLPAVGHMSTARDVAIMSMALLCYPDFYQWSTIWLDTLIHPSGRETMLSNTNRLIRFYDGADGVKTGSTSEAGYCLSATAKRGNTRLIAVVLGEESTQTRFADAQAMLDYGFTNWETVTPIPDNAWKDKVAVKGSRDEWLVLMPEAFDPLCLPKGSRVDVEAVLPEFVNAPIQAGEVIGEAIVSVDGVEIGRARLLAAQDVAATGLWYMMKRIFTQWVMN